MQRIPTSAGELRLSAVLQVGHFDGPLRAREARKNEKALTNQGLSVELGGDEGDRTLDLRIANATLSQLSYVPTRGASIAERRWPGKRSPTLIQVRWIGNGSGTSTVGTC